MPPAADKGPRRDGPNKINILLTSLRKALETGVEPERIVILLDRAITATEAPEDGSARSQSKTFQDVAGTLAKWTAARRASVPAE